MTSSTRLWRLLSLVFAALIPVLGFILLRLATRAPAEPVVVHREIPVYIEVTVPPPPAEPPVVVVTPQAAPDTSAPPAGAPPASIPLGAGTLVFTWRQNGYDQLYALAHGAGAPVALTAGASENRDPAWSPDGSRLAFTSKRERNWDVYVLDVASGALTRVTSDPELDRRPGWSPDGQWLVFESYRGGNFDIYVTSLDGQQVFQVTGDRHADLAPAWSPDGRYIAFSSYRAGNKDIWLADLRDAADAQAINLTGSPDLAEDDPAWSPDGQLLAYSALTNDRAATYLLPMSVPAVTGPATALAAGARPAWSPDGRSVLTVFVPERDLGQSYLVAHTARGVPGSLPAFGGAQRLGAASWTRASLPATAGAQAGAPAARELLHAAWLGQGMTDNAYYSVHDNVDVLDEVSPYWYWPDGRGNLMRYYTADDATFTNMAHSKGLQLYPTIATQTDSSNVRAIMNSPERRAYHIRQIITRVETYGYDGIDIDYEGMVIGDREAFSLFIRELALAMRAEELGTIVTVYPKVHDGRTWIGPDSNDYAALGQYADRVRIMAYEFHSASGPSGPVGPAYWQEQVLAYAVSRIPAEKVILGLHLYGTDWGDGGRAMVYSDIARTLRGTGARAYWDERAQESYFSYSGASELHRVWFPDARFVETRVQLAERFGIGGICFWRLGGEDPQMWARLREARAAR